MMNRSDESLMYQLHHALDPVSLSVAGRVLKLNCFSKAHQHFNWDLLNDIGVINLLRREYLRHGSIVRVFNLYQGTRLDRRSHRFESIFALLVVTIVGTVVAGVILEKYNDNKAKLTAWIQRMKEEADLFGIREAVSDVFAIAFRNRHKARFFDKFCSSTADMMLADFRIILKCYIARRMHDENLISYAEYASLLEVFLRRKPSAKHKGIIGKFKAYEAVYATLEDAINPTKVFLAVDAYGKGMLIQKLESVGVVLDLPTNMDTADLFHGIPASPGAITGITHVLGQPRKTTEFPTVLVADSNKFSPEHLDWLTSSGGAVTANCGMTGHIPVLCRGIGIGCVILETSELASIRNSDPIGLCGTTGVVGVGLLVKLKR